MQIRPIVALASVLSAFVTFPVGAQNEHHEATPKDEARWSTPDGTAQQRYQSARKEAMAALHDNLADCKGRSEEKASCTKDARARFEEEMSEAKKLLIE